MTAAGIGLAAAIAFASLYFARPVAQTYTIRASIPAPKNASFVFVGHVGGPPVLSQDGKNIAFVAAETGGASRIYVRPLGSLEARPLSGTDNAFWPFWSPDGRKLGFFADGKLRVIDIQGGAPVPLVDAPNGRGGSWSPEGTIVFAPDTLSSLYRVPASGGVAVAVTRLDASKHTSHRWPWFLPDGKHFLYLAINHQAPRDENDGIYFASLDGKENVRLRAAFTNPQYAAGFLLYVREGELMAQAFDPSAGKLQEEEQHVAGGITEDLGTWRAAFAVSANGLLA
jgi:Tol biopolymer transport system component